MKSKSAISSSLESRVVALPESRQLEILADLFERRRAKVIRVPLVSILDAPDQSPVVAWLERFMADPPDRLVILTGEGIRRLITAANRLGRQAEFVNALASVSKICRGPKPGRALKEFALKTDILAAEPTTVGVIKTLKTLDLANSRVSVQLYGEDPNLLLMDYLSQCGLESCDSVAPYIYASNCDTGKIHEVIQQMNSGAIDLIVFTSKSQIDRLFSVAKKANLQSELEKGLRKTKIAAIGPIVRDELLNHGCEVHIMPSTSYFMKPLVRAAEVMYASELG
ncbi:MAG: uroporphyrinogen-III synthase [Proteobacteria bacterium]|nr:uroporphyrinogen-III synthase [Pseudomonadota bacterium]MDA1292142.1 uroporphyrinogen-III synthase [Pseudomonadota bacterium]